MSFLYCCLLLIKGIPELRGVQYLCVKVGIFSLYRQKGLVWCKKILEVDLGFGSGFSTLGHQKTQDKFDFTKLKNFASSDTRMKRIGGNIFKSYN